MKRSRHPFDALAGPPRRGVSLIELTVAALLLGTVFAALGPVLHGIRQQREQARQRQVAVLELANQAERLALRSWEELTPERLQQIELSETARQTLRQASLRVALAEEAEPLARRITLELSWSDPAGRAVAPLRVVVWRYPREGGR
jgi:type II secretory pathway pseudopilin PulG